MYIEIDELKRIYARATDVQTEIKKLFNSVNDTLNELCENVRSTSLTSSNFWKILDCSPYNPEFVDSNNPKAS